MGFVKFGDYDVSLNCFFFASVALLIFPMITIILFGAYIYGIILIFFLFYTRYARLMTIIFTFYTLLQCLVLATAQFAI